MMNHDAYDNSYISEILNGVRTVAIVGASANAVRPSYFVAKYLIGKGYTVFPVNPGHAGKPLLGRMTYAKLSDIAEPIDMVDIFRASNAVPGVVDEVLALDPRPKVVWMQLGVRDDVSAKRLPITMSAPPSSASSSVLMWAGSCCPSASMNTRISPVAALAPRLMAAPLPME